MFELCRCPILDSALRIIKASLASQVTRQEPSGVFAGWRLHSVQRTRICLSSRLTATVVLRMKVASTCGERRMSLIDRASGLARGLPLFSRSSSILWKYGCTSPWLAVSPGEGECGGLNQENSPDPSLSVAGNPEALHVATNEECRNRVIHNGGIEGLKLCNHPCGALSVRSGLEHSRSRSIARVGRRFPSRRCDRLSHVSGIGYARAASGS